MITEDEVMRLLERADPVRDRGAAPAVHAACYLDALRTRSITVTLIDTEPTATEPTRDPRWRAIVAAAAAAAVVAIVATGLVLADRGANTEIEIPGGPPSTAAPDTTAAADVSAADAARVGLIGLSPEGDTPSASERGELVDSYFITGADGYQFAGVVRLYADGRLIWRKYFPERKWSSSTGWVEQHLTPEGVELVRTHENLLEKNPLRLHEWLPPSAWKDQQLRGYVPLGYAACLSLRDPNQTGPAQTSSVALPPIEQLLAVLPAPAADLLRGRQTVSAVLGSFAEIDVARSSDAQYDCLALTTDDARRLDRALSDAGVEGGTNAYMLRYQLDYLGRDGAQLMIDIGFEPVFPDGTISCSGCG